MAHLIDTSILVRLANADDVQHAIAMHAVIELYRREETLHVTPQVLIEFRSVATRPTTINGLGLSAIEVEKQSAVFELIFPLLSETPEVFPAWKSLVERAGVIGKQVHDARILAVCHVHQVSHLLTFNIADFVRLGKIDPSVEIIDPKDFRS